MNIPCPNAIRCPGQTSPIFGFDFPIANFSSEAPDQPIIIGQNFGWDYNVPPLGTIWSTPGCQSWCFSSVSQSDADLCAARQQLLCQTGTVDPFVPGPSPGGGGVSDPGTPQSPNPPGQPQQPAPVSYANTEQTCVFTCSTGKKFTVTIPAGQVFARSQYLADEIAHSLACKQAEANAKCTSTFDGFACADPLFENPEYSFQFTGFTEHPPIIWTMSGSPPPGLVMEPSGQLHGIPHTAGDFTFDAVGTDAVGSVTTINSQFHVLGFNILSASLPRAPVDVPYNYALSASGGAVQYEITNGSLPTGLSMDEFGIITGTPTVVGTSFFTVTVTDAFLNTCDQDFILEIHGPKISCPPPGTVCVGYNQTATAVPAGCTFSGSVPKGLVLTAGGNIIGTPTVSGPFTITATDPVTGDTNTKVCSQPSSGISLPVGQPASAAKDLVWTSTETLDPGAAGTTVSGLNGNAIQVTTHGGCVAGSAETAERSLFTTLRNCSAASYALTIAVSYNIPLTPACGLNPKPLGQIFISYNGLSFSFTLLSGTGTASHTYTIPVGGGALIEIHCSSMADAVSSFGILITPDEPP